MIQHMASSSSSTSSTSFLGAKISELFAANQSSTSSPPPQPSSTAQPNRDTEHDPDKVHASCSSTTPTEDLLAASNDAALALSTLMGMRHANGDVPGHENGGTLMMEAAAVTGPWSCAADVATTSSSSPSTTANIDIVGGGGDCGGVSSLAVAASVAKADGDNNDESGDEVPPEAGGEQAEDGAGAPVHEIRCGLLTARLHMQRFTCPGIHRKCVEFEGKLISPRQFTIKAEKDKQKDWKGSIRLGKHNLRTLMEMKTLDFYEHHTNCSLKCQSRNYIKNRKTEGPTDQQSLLSTSMMGGYAEEDGGSGGGKMPITSTMSAGTGTFELSEPNDIHSTTSSAASTRKSSAVLEDYVSQTIPTVNGHNFVPLNLGPLQQQRDNLLEQHQHQQPAQQPLMACNSTSSSASSMLSGNSRLGTPTTATTYHHNSNNHNGDCFVAGTAPTTPTSNGNNNFALLQQQSPLKQLFSNHNNNRNNGTGNLLPAATLKATPNGNTTTTTTTMLGPQVAQQQQQQENNTLALLLQSLQTSILMEQQQQHNKGLLGNNNNNNLNLNNILSPLLNGIGTGTIGTTVQQQPLPSNLLNGLEAVLGQQQHQQPWNNGTAGPQNGIERLLSAAAMFPPQPQQHQPPKANPAATLVRQKLMSSVQGANVRKSMEENAVLFWSQMRSMGLLEDLLNTLSATLERLKHIYLTGGNVVSEEFAAKRLSGVALALDLCTLFSDKIHNRCVQATLETNLLAKELLELQRKQEEQKRKLENAKRKSQVFELLKSAAGGAGNPNNNQPRSNNNSNNNRETGSPPEMKKIHLNI